METAPLFGDVNTAATEFPQSHFGETRGQGSSLPFYDTSQSIVLFSVSHVKMPPIAADAKSPAVRFYGCFANRESALAFATRVVACDPACNIQMANTHSWVVACSNAERCTDVEYCDAKIGRLTAHHQAAIESAKVEFNARSATLKQAGPEPEMLREPVTVRADSPAAATPVTTSFLDASCTLAFQSVLCVSFVKDELDLDEPEFMFRVFRACKDEMEAAGYIKAVASKRVIDHSIDVVDLCVWGYPQSDAASETTYRNKLLDDIMRGQSKTHIPY